ncbi:MAG: hypothetical protein DAHOPDDO_02975 [Ignavibacteriaceae bacterium]|jgi:hypothetical protein|nr:hypothetical protein [Ignavibacteriaceae bacterium]
MKLRFILIPTLFISFLLLSCNKKSNHSENKFDTKLINCEKYLISYSYCNDSTIINKTKIESLIYDSNKNVIERKTDNLDSFLGILGGDEEYRNFGIKCNKINYRYNDKNQLTNIERYLNDSLVQSISIVYKYEEYSYKDGDAYQVGNRKVEELYLIGANVISKTNYIYNDNKLVEIIKNETDNNETTKLIYSKSEYSNEVSLVKKVINKNGWNTEQFINSDLLIYKEVSGLSEDNYLYDCNNNLVGKYGFINHGGYFVQTIIRNSNNLIKEITFTMEMSEVYKEIYEYEYL